jgi:hypothetical protein
LFGSVRGEWKERGHEGQKQDEGDAAVHSSSLAMGQGAERRDD